MTSAAKVTDESESRDLKHGATGNGNAVSDDYEYGESELGQLSSPLARRTPEQTYR